MGDFCKVARQDDAWVCAVCGVRYEPRRHPPVANCRTSASAEVRRNAPCVHLGDPIGTRQCTTCKGNTRLKLYDCPLHGQITQQDCKTCGDYQPFGPTRTVYVHLPPHSFNAAIFEDGGKLRICWRQNWAGATLWLADLDEEYRPSNIVKLKIAHKLCMAGREDPRVFRWRGRLHVSFAGVQLERGKTMVHQLVARLDEAGQRVEAVFEPKYAARQPWEKNWTWLEHEGRLYCLYQTSPQVVLAHADSPDDHTMTLAHSHTWNHRWSGGVMRGGANPVKAGGRLYHFFHGVLDQPGRRPYRVYTVGCVVMEATPPFAPVAYSPHVLAWPPEPEGPQPNPAAHVVFPCGAVLRGDKWLVSSGINDQYCAVSEFDAKGLERALVMVKA